MKKSSIATAGLLTRRIVPCDVEVYVGRIQWHARRILKPRASANERLIRLRSIISAAQDAYEKELERLDSLNSVKADPSMALEIAE